MTDAVLSFADRDAVLGLSIGRAADSRREPVDVPGLAAPVFVRQLTIGEFGRVLEQVRAKPGRENAIWIVAAACDSAGRRLFVDDDLDAVDRLPVKAALAIVQAAIGLNDLTDATVEADAKN